ncbi:MAG: COX15/CtaA family protein [Gemmatimonadota bacterium]|nr:COX15/CtaA family protein [Gemmatimonadota bacterium]MDE2872633.1 COX15/CtaA family protein [Gemmatimonadota bacterium]
MARSFLFFVLLWTLALLFLGSHVHATGASLACPDWPTCFGTMMPEMTGGVFWEHLHRLWAGALVIFFTIGVILIRRAYPEGAVLFRLGLAGIGLLLVQSVLGGITVLFLLPDAVSTSHLALAFVFLALLTSMLALTRRDRDDYRGRDAERRLVRRAGLRVSGLVFAQSVVGALVRHTDAGMACPDVPLCLGRIVPPLDNPMVQLHFLHRVLGLATAVVALRYCRLVLARTRIGFARKIAIALGAGVVAQVLLGFVSVAVRLEPPYVSLHTLLAAVLLSLSVAGAAHAWERTAH